MPLAPDTGPSSPQAARTFQAALAARALVLDGALATFVAPSPTRVAPCDALTHDDPGRLLATHHAYLAAGADIIRTNTFQSGPPWAAGARGAGARARAAARLARTAADDVTRAFPARPRWVAGTIGPPTAPTPSPLDAHARAVLQRGYEHLLRELLDGGVDLLLVETIFRTDWVPVIADALHQAMHETGVDRPWLLSFALADDTEPSIGGVPLAEAASAVVPFAPLAVGVNCGTGSAGVRTALRALASLRIPFRTCHPSAGLPDAAGGYAGTPGELAGALGALVEEGLLDVAGGCCGTTPAHIAALAAALAASPRPPAGTGSGVAAARPRATQC